MTIVGYARASSIDQDLSIQEAALKAAGADVIRSEKRSGTSTAGRAELQTVLEFLRPGDTLLITRIDRLARSIGDLQDIIRSIKAKGASLKARAAFQHWRHLRRADRESAGLLRAVRDGPSQGAPARRHQQSQIRGSLQGSQTERRRGPGACTQGAGRRPSFYRKDAGHWPGVRLQGAGNLRQFDMSSVIFPC